MKTHEGQSLSSRTSHSPQTKSRKQPQCSLLRATGTQRVERPQTQDFRDLPRTVQGQVQKIALAVVEEAIRGRLMTQEVTID